MLPSRPARNCDSPHRRRDGDVDGYVGRCSGTERGERLRGGWWAGVHRHRGGRRDRLAHLARSRQRADGDNADRRRGARAHWLHEPRRRPAEPADHRFGPELAVQCAGELRVPPGRVRDRRGLGAAFAAQPRSATYPGPGRWPALGCRRIGLGGAGNRRPEQPARQRDRSDRNSPGRRLRGLRLGRDRRRGQCHYRRGLCGVRVRCADGRLPGAQRRRVDVDRAQMGRRRRGYPCRAERRLARRTRHRDRGSQSGRRFPIPMRRVATFRVRTARRSRPRDGSFSDPISPAAPA